MLRGLTIVIGSGLSPGCILTAVDGVHACDREVRIEHVRMYCNRGCLFCVSGFYSELSLVF